MKDRFDDAIILAINAFAVHAPQFDTQLALALVDNPLFKGAAFVGVICWYWFRKGDEALVRRTRERLVATTAGAIFALLVARVLAAALPFRARPQFDPDLQFSALGVAQPDSFMNWSSFPSDHAVFFAALAVGIGFISRRAGLLSFVYFLVFIAFPRVFLGIHYPTDVIAGALIGGLIGYAFNTNALRNLLAGTALRWERASPSSFYVSFVMICFQISTMFNSLRVVASSGSHLLTRLMAQV